MVAFQKCILRSINLSVSNLDICSCMTSVINIQYFLFSNANEIFIVTIPTFIQSLLVLYLYNGISVFTYIGILLC